MIRPFHLAVPTKDIQKTIEFYTTVLDCKIGRQDTTWIDFDFYGHQLVFHEVSDINLQSLTNPVDSKAVRVPHFGVILTLEEWTSIRKKLNKLNIPFILDPYIRFKGTPGEQATMFFEDNNGYAVEIKAFRDDVFIFKPFESE